ncbi:venom protease-like [Metopolophium dirhodum]|uniref:venom protease-like n=1 Tax=Metopolophium dirhodum TaxID=44670 RepID=UPI00298FD416|nr:venom protease-like [Metopolophium dirhodum]
MNSATSLQCIFMLFMLCIVRLGCCAPQNKDDVTNTTSNPPVDQPKATESYSAAEMCSNYSKLIYKYIKDPALLDYEDEVFIEIKDCLNSITLIVNGTKAEPKEFPHMALLGYSRYPRNDTWACGGSLISNRWILSAAHCEKLDNTTLVRWARVGDLNYLSETDDARPMDYQIDQRIVHPDYQKPSLYNDIALFHLDQDVLFSSYVRPICLNGDQNWQPSPSNIVIATGWGRIKNAGPTSPDLLRVTLDIIPSSLCKTNYASVGKKQLMRGIVEDSMICAGYAGGEKDTCGGDSGGPLQLAHSTYSCMYTQIGVTSAGKECATNDSPGIYTKVSKYLPWIERIVWPKSG